MFVEQIWRDGIRLGVILGDGRQTFRVYSGGCLLGISERYTDAKAWFE